MSGDNIPFFIFAFLCGCAGLLGVWLLDRYYRAHGHLRDERGIRYDRFGDDGDDAFDQTFRQEVDDA